MRCGGAARTAALGAGRPARRRWAGWGRRAATSQSECSAPFNLPSVQHLTWGHLLPPRCQNPRISSQIRTNMPSSIQLKSILIRGSLTETQ